MEWKKYLTKLKEGKKEGRKEHKTGRRKGSLNSNVSVIKTKNEDWKLMDGLDTQKE